jgi:hypothetical protein
LTGATTGIGIYALEIYLRMNMAMM